MSVKPTRVKIKQVSSDTATGPGISNGNMEIRKGEKVARCKRYSPNRGCRQSRQGLILRYGVMVALQILALSVRVRVLLSQQRQTKVSTGIRPANNPMAG